MKQNDYDWILFAWSLDFIRAVESMPKWRRFLLRIALGRYAAREYVGIREHLVKGGNYIDNGYDLEGSTYHAEKWKWWR